MLPTQVILALLVLQLALAIPLFAVVIQLLRWLHWCFMANPLSRGDRPQFTGPVLALVFSALAATDFLSFEPFVTMSAMNPIPESGRAYFTVAMLALAVWSWAYAGTIRNRVRALLGAA
ncbi:hypothetical protein [Achromobacter arsenitoxydans]|uniref:Uncharacterized protein n=1 Tax=Achromobacter arsenitoxydans SY8 TaxID=477184 RepID=H0F802_9BURK|nr:hypothetical protein [Achromobacter arsenitoxydans]EHK65435.1 hypothetical protein KYC_14502 [Achromobacter arsenitoxydans SY8]